MHETDETTELTTKSTQPTQNVVDAGANAGADTERETLTQNPTKAVTPKSIRSAPKKVPISLSSIRSHSTLIVDELLEKEQDQLSACLQSKCCTCTWMTICLFVVLVILMVPIASIVAGWQISEIWKRYDTAAIDEQCNDASSQFEYNGQDLGSHAHTAFIVGIVDFSLLITQTFCLFVYMYRDWMYMDTTIANIMAGVRIFFVVVWMVYASFYFDFARLLEKYCDRESDFFNDLYDVFEW
eukprot:CAMPEP_0202688908 /NCGR_PEP_ID=MMETSP1385-20130828/4288_1 /ASSEMBLY_ACC=CAM_ASM_000861 /TAXON_ID=933848 /ORGANISM="Elphidium margaritaceum" /LENGTH=240 /DNA_ID=CAMNT_0049343961 /DNA_START=44 /DNA_END=763 /DNA_ORIENTATION=+